MVKSEKFNAYALRIRRTLIFCGVIFLLQLNGDAQSAPEKPDKSPDTPEASAKSENADKGKKGKEGEEKEGARKSDHAHPVKEGSAAGPSGEAKSPEQVKIEMLERIADQLSRRMRSLKEREEAVSAREKSLSAREQEAAEREKGLNDIEGLLKMREDVIQRREKLPPPQTWEGPKPPSIFAQYAVVMDGKSMQFYLGKSPYTHIPVASTQKLVTSLIVCHEGNLDQMVEIPREVNDVEPTVVGVKPGEHYTRRQLLTSLLVKSGNDIAVSLAIDNAGSIEAFARKMNQFAKFIGMKDSHFVNPHGLPAKGQYSSARDIAIAAFEAYHVPEIREIVKKKTFLFTFNSGREVTLSNTNRVLKTYEKCNGMKTGFTYAAGNCLVSSAHDDDKDRIVVMMKSARPHIWDDSRKLLEWSLNLKMLGPLNDSTAVLSR